MGCGKCEEKQLKNKAKIQLSKHDKCSCDDCREAIAILNMLREKNG